MQFEDFNKLLMESVYNLMGDRIRLFKADCNAYKMESLWLESFPPEFNGILRERRVHECNACLRFIRLYGGIVDIVNGKKISIWDFDIDDPEYGPPVKALQEYVHSHAVAGPFLTETNRLGTQCNTELRDGKTFKWHHLYIELPGLVCLEESLHGRAWSEAKSTYHVFQRGIKEIKPEAIDVVMSLIAENNLYRGNEWGSVLKSFSLEQAAYSEIPTDEYLWERMVRLDQSIARLRNTSMGTLLVDLSEGKELEAAVSGYEKMVAPENYKRPNPVYSRRQVQQAQEELASRGMLSSITRRYARIEDITVRDVLFANRDAVMRMQGDVFSEMMEEVATHPSKFDNLVHVSARSFLEDVVPNTEKLEVFVENSHIPNFMSLIAPQDKAAPSLFKWDNGFSWAYNGNITDSSMRQQVQAAGGKTDGCLRMSIMWNENRDNEDDLDLYCKESTGSIIYYGNAGRRHQSSGRLDVDVRVPGGKVAVENIIWTDISEMPDGDYNMRVHCYYSRGGTSGFKAEIEFDGKIFEFERKERLSWNQYVDVAIVNKKGDTFSLVELMPSRNSSKDIWGIKTNTFHPVSVLMKSPNHWDGELGFGAEHLFFMLKGCKNPATPNGFFNEFLKNDFMPLRKFFAALGTKMAVAPDDEQLSGVGFNTTQRNNLICRASAGESICMKVVF